MLLKNSKTHTAAEKFQRDKSKERIVTMIATQRKEEGIISKTRSKFFEKSAIDASNERLLEHRLWRMLLATLYFLNLSPVWK